MTIPISPAQLHLALDTRSALIDLMRVMRKYGRPSKYPADLRAVWDDCELVLGDEMAAAIERQTEAK